MLSQKSKLRSIVLVAAVAGAGCAVSFDGYTLADSAAGGAAGAGGGSAGSSQAGKAGASGTAGKAGAGGTTAGNAGAGGAAGSAGASGAGGKAGNAGSGGAAGTGGGGAAGSAGTGGTIAGQAGSSGKGGAGAGGSAGAPAGAAGSAGTSGATSGAAGVAGTAGSTTAGSGGTAGDPGTGGGGASAGTGGTAGDAGASGAGAGGSAGDGGAGAGGAGTGGAGTGGAGTGGAGTGGAGTGGAGTGGGGSAGAGASCPTNLAGPAMVYVETAPGDHYCIDSTEVMQVHYKGFLDSNEGTNNPALCGGNSTFAPSTVDGGTGCDSTDFTPTTKATYPVRCVDWCDAEAFCRWTGKRLCGKAGGGTLPVASFADATQSQWYNACSNQGTQRYPYANVFSETACNTLLGLSNTAPVKFYSSCEGSVPGLYDMSGNVAEWEDSCSGTGGGSDLCSVRGGDFNSTNTLDPASSCDSKKDSGTATASYKKRRDYAAQAIGFRCCLDLP